MREKWILVVLVSVFTIFGFSFRLITGCKSDCQEGIQSEIECCNDQYDDPDDADKLQTCLDDAKREYQSCIDECENWS